MKTTTKFTGLWMIFSLLALLASGSVLASAQTFTTLDYPNAVATQAYGISDSGAIVGRYIAVAGGPAHGFLKIGEDFASIDYPDAAWTEAWGVNRNGDIVGQYGSKNDALKHGFLRTAAGSFTSIDQNGQYNTMPQSINQAGFIVGCLHNQGTMHGWVMQSGEFLSIGNAIEMYTGVNDSGAILGYRVDVITTTEFSFMLSGTGRTEFQYAGSTYTEAHGLNALGDVVGSFDSGNTFHGFLYHDAHFSQIDFPDAGVKFTRAFGINSKGTIIGVYQDANKHNHGFIREP